MLQLELSRLTEIKSLITVGFQIEEMVRLAMDQSQDLSVVKTDGPQLKTSLSSSFQKIAKSKSLNKTQFRQKSDWTGLSKNSSPKQVILLPSLIDCAPLSVSTHLV